jgi:hypothetical protein
MCLQKEEQNNFVKKATDEYTRIRSRIRNPVYGSKDPDPFQNVTDPEHCVPVTYSVSQGRACSGSVHFDSRGCGPASNRIGGHFVGESSKVDFFDLTVGVDNTV